MTASVVPQVVVSLKSPGFVPVSEIARELSEAVPVFVTVIAWAGELLPRIVLAKVSDEVESVTLGAGAAAALPVRATVCGDPVTLSAMLTDAVRVPAAVGLNVTVMAQLAPTARVAAHVVVSLKSAELAPVIEIAIDVIATAPVFLTVMACVALLLPTVVLAKVSDAGVIVTGATAVPESATDCGEPVALSATLTVAVRLPVAVGLKVTEIVQLAAAASEAPQVVVSL